MGSEDVFLNYSGIKQLSDTAISSEMFQKAKCLYLKRNLLRELPCSIGQLTELGRLHVVGNELEGLPDEIGDLRSLEILDVTGNDIQALPTTIGQLGKLKKLLVGGNKIKRLPKEVGCLKNLTFLDVSRNCLASIPAELSKCESLTTLALDKNRLTSVPRQLGRLQKLAELSLCGNFLEYIPQCLGRMMALKWLYLDNNPALSHLTHLFNLSKFKNLGLNGCLLPNPDAQLCERFHHIHCTSGPVALPEEIIHFCFGSDGGNPVPPLYELALRTVSSCVNGDKDIEELPLLEMSKESLRDPTAVCAQCSGNLFTFACVDFYELGCYLPMYRRVSMLALCCSQKCLKLFVDTWK